MRFIIKFKGGPGSGHHGHAGRPGSVGGSVPGAGGVSEVVRGLFSASVSDHIGNMLVGLYDKALPSDFDGLKEITTKPPKGYDSKARFYVAPDGLRAFGVYWKNKVHVHPYVANRIVSSVAMHELGHHVTSGYWKKSRVVADKVASALRKKTGAMMSRLGLRDNSKKHGAEFLADAYVVYRTGKTGQREFLRQYTLDLSGGELDLDDVLGGG